MMSWIVDRLCWRAHNLYLQKSFWPAAVADLSTARQERSAPQSVNRSLSAGVKVLQREPQMRNWTFLGECRLLRFRARPTSHYFAPSEISSHHSALSIATASRATAARRGEESVKKRLSLADTCISRVLAAGRSMICSRFFSRPVQEQKQQCCSSPSLWRLAQRQEYNRG